VITFSNVALTYLKPVNMKTLFALIVAACMLASCSRSGSTIANDDSVFDNTAKTPAATADRFNGEYAVTEKQLPQEVKTAFYTRYPDAQSVQWALIVNDGNYKADFFILKIKWQAVFAPDGTLLSESHL
jgi:hypothetical protein